MAYIMYLNEVLQDLLQPRGVLPRGRGADFRVGNKTRNDADVYFGVEMRIRNMLQALALSISTFGVLAAALRSVAAGAGLQNSLEAYVNS